MERSTQSLKFGESSTSRPGKSKQIGHAHGEKFTHFISLPLNVYPELKEKLEAFRNSILGDNGHKPLQFQTTLDEMGIEGSIFNSPNTFHLTVVMLKLETETSVIRAQNILKNIFASVNNALDNRPVFIKLKGLDCMTGSLAKTRVLYAPVEEVGNEGRLLRACHVIIDAFVNAAGKDAKSRFKLHATIMNANYRKDKSKKMDTLDAREIHKEFGNNDWGEYPIREAQISKRFWYDSSGYYHCCGSLPFPQN